MYSYKICLVNTKNGVYELSPTTFEFESRDNAEAFLGIAKNNGYEGVQLTILEVYHS